MKKGLVGLALLVAVATGAFVTRHQTVLRLRHLPDAVVRRDIAYLSDGNRLHGLDVYAPSGARNAPVIVFVHGGYWVGGDKDYHPTITGLYGSVGRALAALGVVVVIPNYRLVPETDIAGELDDVCAAVKWTETHVAESGGDPQRLYLMGHSAGGHLVATLGSNDSELTRRDIQPSRISGYIALSAVWDIADMHATQDAAFQERVTYPVFGKDPANWAAHSPLSKLGKSSHPFFLAVGSVDYPYLIPQAERARDALGGAPYRVIAGHSHDDMVLTFGTTDDTLAPLIVQFISGTLK